MRCRNTILRVEVLEDRCTPTTWGNPWPDADHLTLSFVPDGTQVGNQTSNLFQTMNALAPTNVWETTILQAFQTWAAQAKINVAVVADSGLPLGTAGSIQGDARFGDIRIAAYPMAAGAEAESTPFQLDAGTWAGDVSFNSTSSFSVNGGAGQYDLYSVAVHEAGHVFGFDDTSNPASVMYGQYLGVRTGLGPSDVAAIQALYGARTDGNPGNSTIQSATPLNPIANSDGSLSITTAGDLANLQDSDFYSFTSLLTFGAVDVTLQTADISLLTPHVTIFNAWGSPVTAASDTDPQQGGFVIHLTNVLPLSTYYIEVQGGQQNVFGVGNYQLKIREMPYVCNLLGRLNATETQGVAAVTTGLLDAVHTNVSFATATPLTPSNCSAGASYYDTATGSIDNSSDADYYSLQAPPANSGSNGNILTAMVWGLQDSLRPQVLVFDAQHNLLPAQIIVNDGYTYSVQIGNATPGATYFVKVAAANSTAGNYFVGVEFSPNALAMQSQVNGTLTDTQPVALKTLDTSAANQTNLYHFVLSASAIGNVTVQMTITNAFGQVIFTLAADTTEAVTGNVLLPPGVFYVRFAAAVVNGPIPTISFLLLGDILTAPIGPEATDPTGDPGGSSGSGTGDQTTWDDGSTAGVAPQGPSSGPYNSGSAPVVTMQNPTDQTNLGGDGVFLALSASDSASNPLTFTSTGLPPGLTLDPTSGVISGAIANDAANSNPYVVTVTAADSAANSSASQSFYWTVNPPVLTVSSPGDQTNTVGDSVNLPIYASCSDGAPLTYSAASLPPGLAIDPDSGIISGVITADAASSDPYAVAVIISDPSSGVDSTLTFNWTVSAS